MPGGSACGRAPTLTEASKQDVEAALPGPSAWPASDPAPASRAAPRHGGRVIVPWHSQLHSQVECHCSRSLCSLLGRRKARSVQVRA